MLPENLEVQIKELNKQPSYNFEDDILQNVIHKFAKDVKAKLQPFRKTLLPESESSSVPDLPNAISKMSELFISDHCKDFCSNLLEFFKNTCILSMPEPRNLDEQLQTIDQKVKDFTLKYKDFYEAGTNLKLIKYFIEIHVLRPVLEIFNENEIKSLQENFSRILDLQEFNVKNVPDLLAALNSLIDTSHNTSKLDDLTNKKIKAITIPLTLLQFSLYTAIGKLHTTDHFANIHDPTTFSIVHININSLPNHFKTFCVNLTLFERLPDIIAVTETRFPCAESNEQLETKYKIPHFKLYVPTRHRSDDTGGVAMYVNENFEAKLTKGEEAQWEENVYESLYLDIQAGASSFVCGVIYTNQNSDPGTFRSKLNSSLESITRDNETAVICGDLNVDLLRYAPQVFKKIMVKHNFFPCIIRPTRYDNRNPQSKSNKTDTLLNPDALKYTSAQFKTKKPASSDTQTPSSSSASPSAKQPALSDAQNSSSSASQRPKAGSKTLIDHIWFNKRELFLNSAILVDYFGSDHLAVCCSVKIDPSYAKIKKESGDNSFPRILKVSGELKKIPNEEKRLLKHLNYLLTFSNDSKKESKKMSQDIEKADLKFC